MTDKTKAAPRRSQKGRSQTVVNEKRDIMLEFLASTEQTLDKAEVVLAAKGITSQLQDMAEKLSQMEAKDIMPMLDSLRTTFGPEVADQFGNVSTGKIRELLTQVQNCKSTVENEVLRLEKIVNGEDASDLAMGAEAPAAPVAPVGGEPAGELPPGDDMDPMAAEAPAAPPAPELGGASGFAGRAKKESAVRRGRRLTEENASEAGDFQAALNGLRGWSPRCFAKANEIREHIHDLAVSGEIRNKLYTVLGTLMKDSQREGAWLDPETVANLAVNRHFVNGSMAEVATVPGVNSVLKQLHQLAHMIKLAHDGALNDAAPPVAPVAPAAPEPGMIESRRALNVKRLRESNDPDGLILKVFRRVFRECRNVQNAVRGTASAFEIDVADVVGIIREAKRIAEAAVPALMGVEMGVDDPENGQPALMGQSPMRADEPGKPKAPLSPADMRARDRQIKASDKMAAANGEPNKPLVGPKNKVPTQPVPVAGNQSLQPVDLRKEKNRGINLPGKAVPSKIANSRT
jgi:hypothetical protein